MSLLPAQEVIKEWKQIDCTGIELLENSLIWGLENSSNQYINTNKTDKHMLYSFTVNGNEAKIEEGLSLSNKYFIDGTRRTYWLNDETLLYRYAGWQRSTYQFSNNEVVEKVYNMNGSNDKRATGDQIFAIDNIGYEIFYDDRACIYKLDFEYTYPTGTVYYVKVADLATHAPIEILTIGILNNTVYYLSQDGFCSVEVSENAQTPAVPELIPSVNNISGIDESILLVTDKQNRVWIMNNSAGVIEYNATTKEAKKIAEFPNLSKTMDRVEVGDKVCFYSENYLYLMTNKAVYSLNTTSPTPPTPDNPQTEDECGCLGIEFLLALAGLFILRTIAIRNS